MAFSLGKQGALRLFKGQWTVSAVPGEEGLAKLHLEQEMQPAFVPPPPFRRFLRKTMLGKAAQMLSQMRVRACVILQHAAMPSCVRRPVCKCCPCMHKDSTGHRGHQSCSLQFEWA